MTDLWQRLKQRKLVQWALAYLAAAWALLQALGLAADSYDWPHGFMRIAFAVIALGFVVALVLAWYHGEKGRQRVSGPELLLITLVMAIGGALLWRFGRTPAGSPDAAQRNPGKVLPDYAAAAASSGLRATSSGLRVVNAQAAPIPAKSVAVLPFVNMSGDPKQDWFSDGITEEILNALAQAPDLQVAARTSAFAFKGKNEDLRKIGEALGVAHVLEGSVQRVGDEVRITAQLIDTRSGYHLWSEKYDRKFDNVFAVEDEISKAIADKLQAQLGGKSLASAGTSDPRAHELYLRGLTLLAARGPSLRDAADTFRQAVAIDPNYAQAWAGLAQAEFLVHRWDYDTEGTAMQKADAAAQRALELDADLASAHLALGMIHADRLQWADADRELQRALKRAPNDAEMLNQYAQFLHSTGNGQAALPVIERANRLDPYSGVIGGVHAMVLADLRRCAPAKLQVDRTLAVASDSKYALGEAIERALQCRDYAETEVQARHLATLDGRSPDAFATLVRGVAHPVDRAQALRVLGHLDLGGMRTVRWRVALGDFDGALAGLESLAANGGDAQWVWSPIFDPIRNDPRFKALLKRMGLPYTPQHVWAP